MKVYVGIPMYGGAGGEFVSSLLKTRMVLHHCGYEVEVDIHHGCSILTKARNEITQRFFESGFDVLLFLDSDMVFSPVDIVKLLQAGKDLCCINYRVKTEDVRWVGVPETEYRLPVVADGLIKMQAAGTGLMAISRECIEAMRRNYPELRYTEQDKEYFALFDFQLKDGRYYGEDYTFCHRWTDIGGEIWTLPDVTVKHIGTKPYEGNYHEYLLRQPGGSEYDGQ